MAIRAEYDETQAVRAIAKAAELPPTLPGRLDGIGQELGRLRDQLYSLAEHLAPVLGPEHPTAAVPDHGDQPEMSGLSKQAEYLQDTVRELTALVRDLQARVDL
ncbi:hypothetical protein [Nocardia wallacei]|uniref:Uncharacterized protein n=1 Tax=Nocardia wallacei TaxID=480035 RepID=A0A7G1KW06_9NOCA|nr:hypothetical protein [Nocardia wallacei]BCK58353.1 hypothetical protein NWFMUON74_61250 [Nocardia wallacei]